MSLEGPVRLDVYPYSLPLRSPFLTTNGVVTHRVGMLVSLDDGDIRGWGDLCPMPGWSSVTSSEAGGALTSLVGSLSSDRLDEVVRSLSGEVRAAVVGARIDLDAQRHGCSVAAWLGQTSERQSEPADTIAVHATVAPVDVDGAVVAARSARERGLRAVKCKVGARLIDDDVALVAAVRRELGDDVELRLDANGSWTVDEAAEALTRMAEFDIAFCEEPVSGVDRLVALGELPVPVAIDESGTDVDAIRAAIDGGIDVVVMKPQAIGGVDRAIEIAALAAQREVRTVVTTMVESAVGVAHAAHFAAVWAPDQAHGLDTSVLLAADVATPLAVEDGLLHLRPLDGLGVGLPSSP